MRYQIKNILNAAAIVCMLAACSAPSVTRTAYLPAKELGMQNVKRIAVLNFSGNSKVNVGALIESHLASIKVDGRSHFQMVDRQAIDNVFKEQKFSESALVREDTAVAIGKVVAADTLLTGTFNISPLNKAYTKENRVKCDDLKCKNKSKYTVSCTEESLTVIITPKAISAETGAIRYSRPYVKTIKDKACQDSSTPLKSKDILQQMAFEEIFSNLSKDVAPHLIKFQVEFMESDNSEMTDSVQENLDFGLNYVSDGRIDLACQKMQSVMASHKSPATLYNSGVCAEISGDIEKAKIFYKEADRMAFDSNQFYEEISKVINRLKYGINEEYDVENEFSASKVSSGLLNSVFGQ